MEELMMSNLIRVSTQNKAGGADYLMTSEPCFLSCTMCFILIIKIKVVLNTYIRNPITFTEEGLGFWGFGVSFEDKCIFFSANSVIFCLHFVY